MNAEKTNEEVTITMSETELKQLFASIHVLSLYVYKNEAFLSNNLISSMNNIGEFKQFINYKTGV